MKKKFGAVLMAGLMACTVTAGIALSGCGSKQMPDFEMPEGGYDGGKVTITFYNTMGQTLRPVLDSAVARFNKIYPNIEVKTDATSGDYDTVRDKIATQISAGKTPPNVAYCYPDHVALYNESKSVLVLDDFLPGGAYENMTESEGSTKKMGLTQAQVDDYIPEYYAEGKVFGDDKMYTLPFSKSTEVLYYNVDFFEEHNLTPPTTWTEMWALCARIKEIQPNAIPLGYDSESNMFITLCEQYGAPYTSAEEGNHYLFDNEKTRAFVQDLKTQYDKGYFTTKEINKSYTSNLFKEKKSYMSIGSSAGASNQAPSTTDGQQAFEVGIVPIPQVDPEHPKTISQGPSVCIFKQENPQEVIASWLLVKFLTTDVEFQARFSEASGYVPVLKSVFENEVYKENLDKANGSSMLTFLSAKVCKKLVEDKAYYVSPAFSGSSTARDQVGILMRAVFTGSRTIDEAFKNAIKKCEF